MDQKADNRIFCARENSVSGLCGSVASPTRHGHEIVPTLKTSTLSFAASIGLRSVCSPSMILISISIRRAIDEIGASFEPPSNGLDEFSPTFSSEMKTQPTSTLNGTLSQAVQFPIPADFPQFLGIGKETEGYNRHKDIHQNDGDRIVIAAHTDSSLFASIRPAIWTRSSSASGQHDKYKFADELFPYRRDR